MPSYSFKRNVKFYIVRGSEKYSVSVNPDISFSQTFDERPYTVKTLHSPTNFFEGATINKASPANFNFSMPFGLNGEVDISLDWLTSGTDLLDVYVDTGTEIFKIEKAVLESGIFQLAKGQLVTVSFTGTASKLAKMEKPFVIPGVLQELGNLVGPLTDALIPKFMKVELDGVELENITSASIELRNDVQWIENNTLHSSLKVISASDTLYPEAFVVSKKVLSGNIQQYVTDENSARVQTWSTNSTLDITLGNDAPVIQFSLPSVVFTNRIEPGDVFLQNYDYRLNSNSASLTEIIKKEFI